MQNEEYESAFDNLHSSLLCVLCVSVVNLLYFYNAIWRSRFLLWADAHCEKLIPNSISRATSRRSTTCPNLGRERHCSAATRRWKWKLEAARACLWNGPRRPGPTTIFWASRSRSVMLD